MPVDIECSELSEKEFLLKVKELGMVECEIDSENNLWFWTGRPGGECFSFQIKHDNIHDYVIHFMGNQATPDGIRILEEFLRLDDGARRIGHALLHPLLERAKGTHRG